MNRTLYYSICNLSRECVGMVHSTYGTQMMEAQILFVSITFLNSSLVMLRSGGWVDLPVGAKEMYEPRITKERLQLCNF